MWEAYPVNHSLEVVAFCLLALVLSRSKGGRWVDIAASSTFLAAAFTVESGLLVWVVIVAARLDRRPRHLTRRALLVVTLLAAGVPGLAFRISAHRRSRPVGAQLGLRSAAGGSRRAPAPLRRVAVRLLRVQRRLVDPDGAVLGTSRRHLDDPGGDRAWKDRRRHDRQRRVVNRDDCGDWIVCRNPRPAVAAFTLERDDQLVFVSVAVIVANAVISYGYTKDEIMGPAGTFYALAAFCGGRVRFCRALIDGA